MFTEIMEVVKVCRNGDVNKIYVSSLICRLSYQEKINGINSLLSQNTDKCTTGMLIIMVLSRFIYGGMVFILGMT